jgi:beta-glucosidase
VSGDTKVLYAPGATLSGEAVGPVPASALTTNGAGTQPGFRGEYFNNQELQGQAATVRIDPQINFDWGRYKPAPQVNENNFSVRWTGKLTPPETGPYQLGATADDGCACIWTESC